MRSSTPRLAALLALLVAWALPIDTQAGLFGPKGDGADEKKANIRQQRDQMLAQLKASNPQVANSLTNATGYATFTQVNVNLLLLASSNGYGVVVDNKARKETFMRMASLGGGIGAGVKDVRVIFVFRDEKVMKQFVEQGWQFGGQADATAKHKETGVAAEQSAHAGVDFQDGTVAAGTTTAVAAGAGDKAAGDANLSVGSGLEIYQFTESGVSLQATVSGTKYWKDSKLNR